jgi:FMN phosphatase YigB (HAD superfamily)
MTDKSAFIERLIQGTSIEPGRIWFVSDHFEKDIVVARAAGLRTMWVLPAHRKPRSIWGTPSLPVRPTRYETMRQRIEGRAADVYLPSVNDCRKILLP